MATTATTTQTDTAPCALGDEYWYSFAVEPPAGDDWSYIVDDTELEYGPGWWPFYRTRRRSVRFGSAPSLSHTGSKPEPAGVVRLSPDTTFYSWSNEYVLLGPCPGGRAEARLHLWVRRQGMGAIVRDVDVTIDIRRRTFTFDSPLHDSVRPQAEMKARKLLRLLIEARHARRTGKPVATAADLETERQHKQEGRLP